MSDSKKKDANDFENIEEFLRPGFKPELTPLQTRSIAAWIAKPSTFESINPISTGYAAIDNALNGGMQFGGCYVIAGLTGEGKSTLAQNMALRIAAANVTTTIFTLEDPIEHVVCKLVASKAAVYMKRVSGEWALSDEREIDCVTNVKEWLSKLPLRVEEQTETLEDIEKQIRWEAIHAHARVIIVDQSSCVEVPDVRSEYEMHAKLSKSFKKLTKNLKKEGYPIILIVVNQINRTGARNRKAGQGIGMDDIRSSSTWAHDAFGVIVLDVENSENIDQPSEMKIKIEKHRYGRGKDWEFSLAFYKQIQRIDDWTEELEATKPKEEKKSAMPADEIVRVLIANDCIVDQPRTEKQILTLSQGKLAVKASHIRQVLGAIKDTKNGGHSECYSVFARTMDSEKGTPWVFGLKLDLINQRFNAQQN